MNIKAPSVLSITGKLSGGNQQKVVLSQVDLRRPRRADPRRAHPRHRRRRQVRDLHDHQQAGRAGEGGLVISSELPELLGICDRIYTLAAGRITAEVPIAEATPERLMQHMTKEKD